MTCKVELIDKKDPLTQLEVSKSTIKDLFNDLLDERKGFKYQITVKILLKKQKHQHWIFSSLFQFIYLISIHYFKSYIWSWKVLKDGLMKDLVGLLK